MGRLKLCKAGFPATVNAPAYCASNGNETLLSAKLSTIYNPQPTESSFGATKVWIAVSFTLSIEPMVSNSGIST